MLTTKFTELVGCTVPLQQAGMGGVTTPQLAAAVANASGLGMLGVPMLAAEMVADLFDATNAQTSGPIGVNFLMPFVDRRRGARAGRGRRAPPRR